MGKARSLPFGLICLEKLAGKKSTRLIAPLVNYSRKEVYNIGSQMQLWKELMSGTPQGM